MKKENIDYVFNTNFKRRILDENKNVNIENQIDQLLSNFEISHFKSLISKSSC
jgi:hypothetical protein